MPDAASSSGATASPHWPLPSAGLRDLSSPDLAPQSAHGLGIDSPTLGHSSSSTASAGRSPGHASARGAASGPGREVTVREVGEASGGVETERREGKAGKKRWRERLKPRGKAVVVVEHLDIIGDGFWKERPWILGDGA